MKLFQDSKTNLITATIVTLLVMSFLITYVKTLAQMPPADVFGMPLFMLVFSIGLFVIKIKTISAFIYIKVYKYL
jgi:hypothetical protein